MYDNQIRQAFHTKILNHAHQDNDTLVVDELGIQNGSYRADIAVLNGKLEGFEIKGEHDSLERLPEQVHAYNSIFKNISLITCKKYLEKSFDLIPVWWGVYLAEQAEDCTIKFKKIRPPKLNKNVCRYSLAQLLWRDEALEIAKKYAPNEVRSRHTRHDLYSILAGNFSKTDLSKIVLNIIKQREHWRSGH